MGDGCVALRVRLRGRARLACTRPWVPSSSLKTEGMEKGREEGLRNRGGERERSLPLIPPGKWQVKQAELAQMTSVCLPLWEQWL